MCAVTHTFDGGVDVLLHHRLIRVTQISVCAT